MIYLLNYSFLGSFKGKHQTLLFNLSFKLPVIVFGYFAYIDADLNIEINNIERIKTEKSTSGSVKSEKNLNKILKYTHSLA